jgi:hypothetical protein
VSTQAPVPAKTHPLAYVVPLYLMQAMPVFLVQDTSKIIFASLGVPNQNVATWTALISLPWSFKLLWGPIVELNRTKRQWINGAQLGIAALMILFAMAIQIPNLPGVALAILTVTAVFSATCDIATDGYYLLATDRQRQRVYVGWQSTMFRLGRLFVTGGIVWFSGVLIQSGLGPSVGWMIGIAGLAAVYGAGAVLNFFFLPRPPEDALRVQEPSENKANFMRTGLVLASFGFLYVGLAYGFGLVGHFLSAIPLFVKWQLSGDLPLFFLFIDVLGGAKLPSLTIHAIYAAGGLAIGGLMMSGVSRLLRGTQIGTAFGAFLGQKDIFRILFFVMFYRFGEALLGNVVPLFLLDKKDGPADPTRGLALAVDQVGWVNGVFGVVGIVLGGILGGLFVSRLGVRRSFWILAAAMNVPNLLYLWASLAFPAAFPMAMVMFFDQFGYGFGFAGYLICLQAIAQRNPQFTTAHYAIGTGLGAFLIAGAGTLGGAFMAAVDFPVIFTLVLFFSIPCLLTIRLLPLQETEGLAVSNTDVAD